MPRDSALTKMRRRVAAKVTHMSQTDAAALLEKIRLEGVTIFHPTIRELTGGFNSQSINAWVKGKLIVKAGLRSK